MRATFPTNHSLNQRREFAWYLGAFIFLMLFVAVDSHCQVLEVTVVSVHDGDTLRLSFPNGFQFDARLHGIDAPELLQNYGETCRSELITRTGTTTLRVWIISEDQYNRKLVKLIRPDFSEINYELLESGCAFPLSPRRSERDKYRKAYANAFKNKIGLFSAEKFCEPYKWRKGTCTETP